MRRMLLCLLLLTGCAENKPLPEGFQLKSGTRVVFLGDSNTFAGTFIGYLDGYLATRFPEHRFELLNLGLPSETVSGTSEKAHPYPRPCIHDRLNAVLERTRPNVVVICYGMNDGIYAPFDAGRFQKYQEGMRKLLAKVKAISAQAVLMTPAPFDAVPLAKKVVSDPQAEHSWMTPYAKYDDETLAKYAEWLRSLRDEGYLVADPHAAIREFVQQQRKGNPQFTVSRDGIHPDQNGHALIFRELARTLGAPALVAQARFGTDAKDESIESFTSKDGVIAFDWTTPLPMPLDPNWVPELLTRERILELLNYHAIRGQFVFGKRYKLEVNGIPQGELSGEELTSGLNLARFSAMPTQKLAAEIGTLAQQRTQLLGLAWLTEVGHRRPDTPKGIPLAEAQKQAAQLDSQIRKLARPMKLSFRFRELP